jgi:hypothetical protein
MDALLNKTQKDLVARSNDAIMKDHFQYIVGIHHPDDSILADFFDWALAKGDICSFITCDGEVDRKKDEILAYVRDSKKECDYLSIWYVTSAARRLCPCNESSQTG